MEADIKIAIRRNPDFRNEVELNGIEYTMDVVKEQVKILAMTIKQNDLDEVVKAYQTLDKDRSTGTYKIWESAFQDLMKQSSTSWDGYKGAIKVGDRRSRIETRHRIEEKIAKGHSGFRNAISKFNPFFGRSRFSQADRMVHGFDMIEQLRQRPGIIKEVDEALAVITRFMAFTLDHDPEVQRALQQSAFRNENISPPESKPSTFKEARAERARLESGNRSEAAVQRDWDAYRRTIGNWNKKTPEQRAIIRDGWTPSSFAPESTRTPEGRERHRSFLGRVLEALVGALLGRRKDNLSLNNV